MNASSEINPGDRVIALRRAPIQVGGHNVGFVFAGSDLIVEKVSGRAVWVNAGTGGWLAADAVVAFDNALERFNQLLRHDSKNWELLGGRVNVRFLLEQWDEAIEELTKLLQADPKSAQLWRMRGDAYVRRGDHEQAIDDFSKAIDLDAHDPFSFIGRAFAWLSLGYPDQAISNYGKAILLNPHDAQSLINRGIVWAQKGCHDKSIDDYREALLLNRDNHLAHNNLAWQYSTSPDPSLRDGKKASFHAEVACNLADWKMGLYIGTLAATYAEVGLFDEAVKLQARAFELYSEAERIQWGFLLDLYKDQKPYRQK